MFRFWKKVDRPEKVIKKVMIFDFDGTIADTIDEVVRIYNLMADRYGYKKVNGNDVENLRGKRPRELLKWMGIPFYMIPFILRIGRREMRKKIPELKTTVNMRGLVTKLKKMGFKVGILTTNSKDNVTLFLKRNRLEFFDFIYAGGSIFGKHKMLKRLIREIKVRPEEAVYVGDEIRDIEAAKRCGVSVVSVTWGYNNEKALMRNRPDYIVRTPVQLLSIAKKMRNPA
jgi:phosphoglycolate phosphatase-like HAD superfamily hydrolase